MTDQWPLVFTYISLLNLNMWIVNIRQVVSQDFNFHCKKLKHVLISLSLEAGVPTRVATNFCFHSPSSPEYMQWKQKLATTDKFQRESLLLGHYRYPSNNMRNKLRLSSASGQNGEKKDMKRETTLANIFTGSRCFWQCDIEWHGLKTKTNVFTFIWKDNIYLYVDIIKKWQQSKNE